MKVLIVHAHHEPKSFSSALARQAEQTLKALGNTVAFADLYAEKFDPVSDRRNFKTVKDPNYLKQQAEETHASMKDGFAPSLEREIRRLEWCELLIFSYPLWWFGMPAILKGWIDRVFVSGRIYGGEKIYETGLGKSRKRGLVLLTTGGGPDAYSGYGVNPSLKSLLAPVQHGVFWFNGFKPLAPFVAWSPTRISSTERGKYLEALDARLRKIDKEPPQVLPPLSDFPGWGRDQKKRFMVTITRTKPLDNDVKALIPAEIARIEELTRDGIILSSHFSTLDAEPWRGFLHVREEDAAAVRRHLDSLPMARWLSFGIVELM